MSRYSVSGLRKSFLRSVSGNVTVLFAFGLAAICGAAGAAVDFVRIQNVQTKVQSAADAAALAAVSFATASSEKDSKAIKSLAEAEALKAWQQNVSQLSGEEAPKPKITVKESNGQWSATISFEGEMPTSLLAAVGIPKMGYAGQSEAGTASEESANVELAIVGDVSASMLMGATPAEMAKITVSGNNCGFACHNDTHSSNGNYVSVKRRGVRLRLDQVNDSIASLMGSLERQGPRNVKVSLYKFAEKLEQVVSATEDLDRIAAAKLEPVITPISKGNSYHDAVMTDLAKKLGKSPSTRSDFDSQRVVIMLTDGMIDKPFFHNRSAMMDTFEYIAGMDPVACKKLKDSGVKLAIVLTRYYAPGQYASFFKDRLAQYQQDAKACASDGLFAFADSGDEITQALKELTGKAMSGGAGAIRLTQ